MARKRLSEMTVEENLLDLTYGNLDENIIHELSRDKNAMRIIDQKIYLYIWNGKIRGAEVIEYSQSLDPNFWAFKMMRTDWRR